MINIILRGCNGKMGQEITKIVESDKDTIITAGIDISSTGSNKYPVYSSFSQCPLQADVIVDFSSPKNLIEMLEYAKETRTGIVLCTTGYTKEEQKIIDRASRFIPIFQSANMSMGINVITKLIKEATKVLVETGFDIEIVEKHHNKKVDAPSGTALALADAINSVLNNEYEYRYDRSQIREQRETKEIGISAVRGGTIVGEHEVIFAGTYEVIEIKHTAYSKAIFAKGAVAAAKFLSGKGPGKYEMSDIIG